MDNSYNCVICLKDLDMDNGVLTPCNHRYHSECFFKWIFKKRTCPLCRKELIAQPDIEERASLYELRRQIDWESSLYNTLRNNVDTLDNHILTKKKELENLNSQVHSRQNQLVTIIERYKGFMQSMQRNHRNRRRRGLLF
ncbi:MAG: hypothetical protein CXT73_03520 [Methanobacteriota archaeon]|jgi:DNA repair exonuclease SbcCD ATPase subunit|nr:MAG: hypothetical protein CXT73_03520 [Euryarchaeota archaeon]